MVENDRIAGHGVVEGPLIGAVSGTNEPENRAPAMR